jgi:phthalate 4,5-dioxygenase oxygenase subunit
MLSPQENETLCRVGPDTPMGSMLRRYWVPACLSEELPDPGGAPKRIRLLGEDLVAFRGSDGKVGIMDERCPHRRASLALGRNEDCALVCLYHGWKIAADGQILDMPSEAEDSTFKDRLRHLAYPVREKGSLVWVYMGPVGTEPELPSYNWMEVAPTNRAFLKVHEAANWVQAMEGAIDSAHSLVLHKEFIQSSESVSRSSTNDGEGDFLNARPSNDTRPRLDASRTPYGFHYAAIRRPIRNAENDKYVRVTAWAAPFYCFIPPNTQFTPHQFFVPIDDHNTHLYFLQWSETKTYDQAKFRSQMGGVVGLDLNEDYRKVRTLENDYLQDRAAMDAGRTFSGIQGLVTQDMAMQETMGPIVDRSREHLGTSDIAIITMRRVLLDSVKAFQAGQPPVGLAGGYDPSEIVSYERVLPKDRDWRDAFRQAAATGQP